MEEVYASLYSDAINVCFHKLLELTASQDVTITHRHIQKNNQMQTDSDWSTSYSKKYTVFPSFRKLYLLLMSLKSPKSFYSQSC